MKKVRVLIVDDSALMRKKITEMLDTAFGIDVIGTARNGEDGINKAMDLKPDVITLDVNMPVMDGLTALRIIIEKEICPVVMLSSLTHEGRVRHLRLWKRALSTLLLSPAERSHVT